MVDKPSTQEEEYFAKQEYEKKRKLLEQHQTTLAAEEKKRLRELHYMRCPKCGMELIQIDYKTISVDRCSQCEGLWLDAGELKQIIEVERTALDKLFRVFRGGSNE